MRDTDSDVIPKSLFGWAAFDAEVRAAAPGRVMLVQDRLRDHSRPGTGWIDWRTADPRGNYVVVKHGPGRYSLYAHLAKNSVAVRPGDLVAAGERLGRVGSSGHSTEPHLHFQLQDRSNFFLAVGLPVAFTDATPICGPLSEQPGTLRGGQKVKRGAPGPGPSAAIRVNAGFEPLLVGVVALVGVVFAIRALVRLAAMLF